PVRDSRSFGRRSSVWADGSVRAAAETGHARAGELSRGGLESAALDARDSLPPDRPAPLEVFPRQRLLAIFLQARRLSDAEDVLAHVPPDPVLRIPERQEARLKAQRLAVVID